MSTVPLSPLSFVIGGPSLVSVWAYNAVTRLVQATHGRVHHAWVDRKDADLSLLAAVDKPTVLMSRYPPAALLEALRDPTSPLVVISDDPLDMVIYQRSAHGTAFLSALRTIAISLTAPLAWRDRASVLHIHRDLDIGPAQLLGMIRSHLRLPVDDAAVERVAAAIGASVAPTIEAMLATRPHYLPRQRLEPTAAPALMTQDQARLVTATLNPLYNAGMDRRDLVVDWPFEVFLSADRPDTALPEWIELTGPARNLAYGPYLHLPPGHYDVEFRFDPGTAMLPMLLSLELYAGKQRLTKVIANFERHGRQAASFEVDHADPGAAIELRVRMERGAIDGRARMLGMTFTHRGA